MNKNPYGLKTVMDWDDGRKFGDPIMVTTVFGLAFDAGDDLTDGSHVCGFDAVADAKLGLARKRLQKCSCPRCAEGIMREQIERDIDGTDNTPQADGFRSFPEWIETADIVRTLV